MPRVTVLTEKELRDCVSLDRDAIAIVEHAFAALAGGDVVMPPILSMAIPAHHGEVDVKTAYVPGLDGFAIKVSPGFFDNPAKGLPSLNGLMIVLSAETGVLQAVLLDNGYLTDVRTAAAGAVAARHLARKDAKVAGVIGTGLQARLQIAAMSLVRDLERVLVWGRDAEKTALCVDDLAKRLGIAVEAVGAPVSLVRASDIVVTTTPAEEPLIAGDWLHPGLHITAMGSDADYKNELAPGVIAGADLFICDRRQQSATVGELRSAIAAGVVAEDVAVSELGEIVAGSKPGRTNDDMVTVCDLTGTGVQDTAIATHALKIATTKGYGTTIDS